MVHRGEIWYVNFPEPIGSEPGFGRPAVVVQSDTYNDTALNTVVVVGMSTNQKLAHAPGNVLVRAIDAPVPEDCVVVVTQIMSVDRSLLVTRYGELPQRLLDLVDEGVRQVLELF